MAKPRVRRRKKKIVTSAWEAFASVILAAGMAGTLMWIGYTIGEPAPGPVSVSCVIDAQSNMANCSDGSTLMDDGKGNIKLVFGKH